MAMEHPLHAGVWLAMWTELLRVRGNTLEAGRGARRDGGLGEARRAGRYGRGEGGDGNCLTAQRLNPNEHAHEAQDGRAMPRGRQCRCG